MELCKGSFIFWRYVADLIHFGAVYYALVCPNPPPTATPQQFRAFKEATALEVLKTRMSIKGKTVKEAQKTYRITQVNEFVEPGTYLRVHVHPKRFPRSILFYTSFYQLSFCASWVIFFTCSDVTKLTGSRELQQWLKTMWYWTSLLAHRYALEFILYIMLMKEKKWHLASRTRNTFYLLVFEFQFQILKGFYYST